MYPPYFVFIGNPLTKGKPMQETQVMTRQAIDAFGDKYNYDVTYMHKLLQASSEGYRLFEAVLPLAAYRSALPAAVYYVARIEAMRHEDCGPCLQLAIDMAKEEEVSIDVLRAAWKDEPFWKADLEDVRLFSRAVAANTPQDEAVAERVADRYGEEGVAELALCIAVSRVFPTIKRVLGEAKSCSMVEIKA